MQVTRLSLSFLVAVLRNYIEEKGRSCFLFFTVLRPILPLKLDYSAEVKILNNTRFLTTSFLCPPDQGIY